MMVKLKVGKRGEIYTTREIRRALGIEAPGEVVAVIRRDGVLLKPRKPLRKILEEREADLIEIDAEEFERLSEECQREMLGEA